MVASSIRDAAGALLKEKGFDEPQAEALLDVADLMNQDIATRADIDGVRSSIDMLRSDMNSRIGSAEIAMVKWMVGLAFGSAAAVLSIGLAFIRLSNS